jgi:hypothetical protein
VNWPPNWVTIEDSTRIALEAELRKELNIGHPLYGVSVTAIRQRVDQDDVSFGVLDGSGRFADVHLTYTGRCEPPPCPWMNFFESLAAWMESVRDQYDFAEDAR